MSKANARRPIAALTAALLCVALAACGGGGGDDTPRTQTGGSNQSTTTATASSSVFASGLNQPAGVARHTAEDEAQTTSFLVADKGSFSIRRISADGSSNTVVAGSGAAGAGAEAEPDVVPTATANFSDLRSITVAPNGAIYVVDGTTVRLIDGGNVIKVITNLTNPQGVVVDAAFNVFVADAGAGTITRGTGEGVVTVIATGLTNPTSLALDSNGNLYVTEVAQGGATTLKRIAGAATAPAATPGAPGTGTNVANATGLSNITGITVGSNGTIHAVGPRSITTIPTTGSATTKSVQNANAISGVTTAATGNTVLVTDSGSNNILRVTP